ncbi:MAG TPA: cytochrome c [Burkholderiales bacterium]|jgi:cytochrome c55X|nr:cytochrome c [Burkholderiales bacterium]
MLKALFVVVLAAGAPAAAAQAPTPERGAALAEFVRQDCGFCHGLHLTGGLGPSLAPADLADKDSEYLAMMIVHGRRGTAMPAWRGHINEDEARWIVEQLKKGLAK